MSTRMSFFRRKAGLSAEGFSHHWRVVHAPIALAIPALQSYEQNIVVQRHDGRHPALQGQAIDGICRLRFGDSQAMQGVMSPEMVARLKADEAEFLTDLCTVTLESVTRLPPPAKPAAGKFLVFLAAPDGLESADIEAAFAALAPHLRGRLSNQITARSRDRQPVARAQLPLDLIEELWPAPELSAAKALEVLDRALGASSLQITLFDAQTHIPGVPRP